MNFKNHKFFQLAFVIAPIFLLSACLDSGSDDDKGGGKVSNYVGIWVGDCTPEPENDFGSSRTQLEFLPDGSAINSGLEYSDEGCVGATNQYGPNNATITIGEPITDTAGRSGFQFDFQTADSTKYQIITGVSADPDTGVDFFQLGLETEALDGSSPATRPDTFEQKRFYKTSVGITSFE